MLERSVRRGELADKEAVPDLQAVLIGAVLMLVLFEPEMDEGLLRNKIADLARGRPIQRTYALGSAADDRGSCRVRGV